MDNGSLTNLRKKLHQNPELSGSEKKTAEIIRHYYEFLSPTETIDNLGGHGLAFVFQGKEEGPTLLFRCDMDAVPIHEATGLSYESLTPGVCHACGHDGHMTILAGVGKVLTKNSPIKGRVILLYQPAEETGEGAQAVIQDPLFSKIKPDLIFALHNLPGYPLGELIIKSGTFCCTSRGMIIHFTGKTAHASQPETGKSPENAMCHILETLRDLPEAFKDCNELILKTVVGARLGEKAFGVSPGDAEIWVTLRCETDQTMDLILTHLENLVKKNS